MAGMEAAARIDEELIAYLKSAKRRFGFGRPDRLPTIPRSVAEALSIDTDLSPERQVQAFAGLLTHALRALAEKDLQGTSYAAIGLNLNGDDRMWLQRADARAKQDGESRRTVERRVNAALELLAVELAARQAPVSAPAEEKVPLARLKQILRRREELRVLRFDVTIRVFFEEVQVHEVVEVLAQAPEAQFYVVGKTLPYRTSEVKSTVLHGAELLATEQPNPHWLLELLELPEPLAVGREHRFAVLHHTEGMAPMWTATVQHPMDSLRVQVVYADRERRPTWLIEEFPPRLLRGDNITPILEKHAEPLPVDRLGNASYTFTSFVRGHSYGIGWSNP